MTEGGQISFAAVGYNLKSPVLTCMVDQLTGDNLSYQNESQNNFDCLCSPRIWYVLRKDHYMLHNI